MKANIYVTLRRDVLDPQGKAVCNALRSMGYNEIKDLRIGKFIAVELDGASGKNTEARLREMCERLIANTVIEDFRVEIK